VPHLHLLLHQYLQELVIVRSGLEGKVEATGIDSCSQKMTLRYLAFFGVVLILMYSSLNFD
jgi:hypothetical protein